MQHKSELNEDFYRAVFLLKKRFHTPADMLRYWSFSRTMFGTTPSN